MQQLSFQMDACCVCNTFPSDNENNDQLQEENDHTRDERTSWKNRMGSVKQMKEQTKQKNNDKEIQRMTLMKKGMLLICNCRPRKGQERN
jgi:hypothetical protein